MLIGLEGDRPEADWPLEADGRLKMETRPLNTAQLLREVTTQEQ
jgi:catechol-2,3-dioxygenase